MNFMTRYGEPYKVVIGKAGIYRTPDPTKKAIVTATDTIPQHYIRRIEYVDDCDYSGEEMPETGESQ